MTPKRQTFRSQYGRKGISVPAECPTVSIRHHLGRTHVGTPAAEVEREIRAKVEEMRAKSAKLAQDWTPAREETAVRFALWQHAENLAEYQSVMAGRRLATRP